MSDMWRAHAAPTPLDFNAIQEGRFFIQRPSNSSTATGSGQIMHFQPANGHANGKTPSTPSSSSSPNGVSGLRDRRELSLHDTLELSYQGRHRCHTISYIPK
ncbi:hypothetical protein BDR03DRAFT_741950 [Suillus americanus]|nr:hypothetical protein BDR03DRAFT_741950 [Suillus americanus]